MRVIDRFMAKVGPEGESGCWEWTARKTPQGYGRFFFNGRNALSNRVAWELFVGPIPSGLHVLHRCDNPACVNPRHLWLGTNADNVADKVRKGRTQASRGEENPRARLSRDDVIAIRRRYGAGVSSKELSAEYQVARNYIPMIAARKVWRHV